VFYSVPKTGTGFLVPVFGTGFWYMCHWHYSTLHLFHMQATVTAQNQQTVTMCRKDTIRR